MLLRDLFLVLKNSPYLPKTFLTSETSDQSFRNQFSETNVVTNAPSVSAVVKELVVGNLFKDKSEFCFQPAKSSLPDEDWFYLNGILTTLETDRLNRAALESLFQKPISSLYNPTNGVLSDLLECVQERTFDHYAKITLFLYEKIVHSLKTKNRVVIIAHSQGGIILSNLLKLLRDTEMQYPNLEVYTFASAADEDVDVRGVYQEHFGNELDFVARAGLMFVNTSGAFFTQPDAVGHLLNRDHLEHFKSAKYCNGNSRLYKYIVKR